MSVSLVPRTDDVDVYVVLDELQTQARVWHEMGLSNEAAVIEWMIEGQFDCRVRVVAFNTAEGWSRDVSEDVARKLLDMSRQGRVLGASACRFVELVTGEAVTAIV